MKAINSSAGAVIPDHYGFISSKLDRTNYPLWLAQIVSILKSKNLMGFVISIDPCPPEFKHNTNSTVTTELPSLPFLPSFRLSPPSHPLLQVRQVSSRERKKNRKPMTPLTSKVKKFKMKAYSSYKDRFRTMNDGTIRRWREGKNHNAHLKSKKSRRRLRQPSTVPAAYAKVMKKLSFCV
uniref:Ribosomal protein L35 n=2 Tax=Populus alba TaxID=43335 RepID=A0A4U5NQJ8_POPAL|nr:hypothetical protein D5086_0000242180 [Populus alba]